MLCTVLLVLHCCCYHHNTTSSSFLLYLSLSRTPGLLARADTVTRFIYTEIESVQFELLSRQGSPSRPSKHIAWNAWSFVRSYSPRIFLTSATLFSVGSREARLVSSRLVSFLVRSLSSSCPFSDLLFLSAPSLSLSRYRTPRIFRRAPGYALRPTETALQTETKNDAPEGGAVVPSRSCRRDATCRTRDAVAIAFRRFVENSKAGLTLDFSHKRKKKSNYVFARKFSKYNRGKTDLDFPNTNESCIHQPILSSRGNVGKISSLSYLTIENSQ